MYCSKCGQAIGSQPLCTRCGAPTGIVSTGIEIQSSRIAGHLHTLGILWVVFSAYLVLRWILVLPILHAALGGKTPWIAGSGSDTWIYAPFHPGGGLLHFITVMVFARAILSLAAGIALLTRQPWGRVFAIVIAVLTLIKPVLGSLLAIYTLWVLFSRNADLEYDRIALSGNAAQL